MTLVDKEASGARRNDRIAFFQPVKFRKPEEMLTQGVDLGIGGLGVRARKPLAKDTPVEVELFEGKAIFLGTVRWCQPLGSGFRMGIQFREEDVELVARVLEMRTGKGGSAM